MKEFKNILVGLDLSEGDRLVGTELTPPTRQALDCGLWLAKLNGARLTLQSVIDVPSQVQEIIQQDAEAPHSLMQAIRTAQEKLHAEAAAEGIDVNVEIAFGRSWMEMIRQVLSGCHDLVIVGSREHGGLHNTLLGSTGTRLLRKCPCPVWVTRPHDGQQIQRILVAHDLRDVGRRAVDLGASMAEICSAELHVLHAIEPPSVDEALAMAGVPEQFEVDASQAGAQLKAEVDALQLTVPPQAMTIREDPATAILDYCQQNSIDLLVMGTIARSGIPGMLMGNTAERLLPLVRCSVLAAKPDDFVCPVSIK